MQSKIYLKLLVALLVGIISTTTWGKIINQASCNGKSYTLQFTCKKAMLSRDGGEAVPVHSGTTITKPGTYYLCLFNPDGLSVQSFIIKSQSEANYEVSYESELVEIFKKATQNYQAEITLTFKYKIAVNKAPEMIAKRLKEALTTYPILMCNLDQCYVYIQNKSHSVIKVKLNYPLKVVNNMKKLDNQAISEMTQMVNECVTSDMKDYQIEEALVKALLKKVSYSLHATNTINATSLSHTLQATYSNGKIVCDGYAKTFMYLMNMVGVPTRFVEGSTINQKGSNLGHAWNLVKIQGNYYHVDTTWADQYFEMTGFYNYINEQDSFISKTHIWDTNSYPRAIVKNYCLPFAPVVFNKIYKVTSKSTLDMVLGQIKKNGTKTGNLIFYEQSKNNWQEKSVIAACSQALSSHYHYSIENKYDCLIVYFSYY